MSSQKKNIGVEYIDDLSGLYNRRYLDRIAFKYIQQTSKRNTPLSVIIIDLDHFKNINDTYGHSKGDAVLIDFASFLKDFLRKDDIVFRYGGDEFVCILPDTRYKYAIKISSRLIDECHSREFSRIRLTYSIGIASFPGDGKDWLSIFNVADHRLYSAKRHGRDRIGILMEEGKKVITPTKEIIGREKEIARINNIITRKTLDSKGTVCICGEIGIGKTRLVNEIANNPRYRDYVLLWSNLSATTKFIPYYPLREIIRSVFRKKGRDCISEIHKAYQIELNKIVPELSDEQVEMDKNIFMLDKFRLFEGVRRFLELQASISPLFICLDNIHWADDSSLELICYLVRSLKNSRVFFFMIYRVEEAQGALFQNITQSMEREKLYERIELEPLGPADVVRLLSHMVDASTPPELSDYIYKETGGNPFFIEELMKSLETNDAFIWDKGELLFDEDRKAVIPHSVKGVVDRKMNMMSKESCELLEYLAVIGREFDFTLLHKVTGINEGHLFDLMDEILRMRLLKEAEGGLYCFSEDVIREVVYLQINSARLMHYHGAIGKVLLSISKDNTEEIAEELSHHFYLSRDLEKTIKYSIQAANKAKDTYANQNAIEYYSRTLECLKDSSIEDKKIKEIEILKKKATVLDLVGENEKAAENLSEAIKIARKLSEKKWEADCLIALCKVHFGMSHYDDTIEMADIALGIYRELADKKGEAKSLNAIGVANWYLGEFDSALKLYQSSLKIAESINDRQLESKILGNSSIILWNLGNLSKALEYYLHALEITKDLGDIETEARALNNIGLIYGDLGDNTKALECYEQSLKISDEIGSRKLKSSILNNMGIINVRFGEYTKAIKNYMDSVDISMETGIHKVEAIARNNIGSIHYYLGDYSRALEYCKHSLKISREIGDRQTETESLVGIGNSHLELGELSDADDFYEKAYSIALTMKSKSILAEVLISATSLYLEKNDLAKVRDKLDQLKNIVDTIDSRIMEAYTYYLSGRLSIENKKWNKAKISFEKSLSTFQESNRHLEIGQIHYYLGLMYRKSGNKISSKKSLNRALEIFNKLDAKGWIEKIEVELLGQI